MSQPSYTRRNTCGAALLRRMSARVLTTREKPALPCTGFHTGAPSIGTSIAGALPTITRGNRVGDRNRLRLVVDRRERHLQPVERYGRIDRRQRGGERRRVRRAGQRRLGHLDVGKGDRPRDAVDVRSRRRLERAERLVAHGLAPCNRAAEGDRAAVPAHDLRRIDEQRGIGKLHVARPARGGHGGARSRGLPGGVADEQASQHCAEDAHHVRVFSGG
jgi:hypothetical protein